MGFFLNDSNKGGKKSPYKENFNITPTLIWFDEESKFNELGLSKEYGDVIFQKPHPGYQVPWQTTWGLFYFTKFFKDEVCMTMGIDQIPLSTMFVKDLISKELKKLGNQDKLIFCMCLYSFN